MPAHRTLPWLRRRGDHVPADADHAGRAGPARRPDAAARAGVRLGAVVANRRSVARHGLVGGLLTASAATGPRAFPPVAAWMSGGLGVLGAAGVERGGPRMNLRTGADP